MSKRTPALCKAVVDGADCGRKVIAFGYCDPHYRHVKAGRVPGKIRQARPLNATLARDAAGNKQCIYCHKWLPLAAFHVGQSTADKLQVFCKDCGNVKRAAREALDPDMRKRYYLLRRYGLSIEDYDRMWEAQGKRCAICRTEHAPVRGWHVDHDHAHPHPRNSACPKCVRGILCHHCNTALGHLKDDPDRLRAAIAYLEGSRREDTGLGPGDDSNQVVHVEPVA